VDDVILDEFDAVYEVRAVDLRQMLREIHCAVEKSRQAQSTYYLVES
jgi:hypothetical protein